MADFIGSLREGINSAVVSRKNIMEVEEVFSDLQHQLLSETDNKLLIEIRGYEPENILSAAAKAAMMMSRRHNVTSEEYRDFFIVAKNPSCHEENEVKLAGWVQDKKGYPCRIKISNEEVFCEDKEGLENGIKRMLEDPQVGAKIYNLINHSN